MASQKTSVPEQYTPVQSFRKSARLHTQHWMWQYRLGYLLHPSIARRPDMRVIDVGTGNACWLLDLAHQSPRTWQLEGVDFSRLHYPAKEYLPENVSLKTMDVFGYIPNDMIEAFDVVHIRRAFALVVHSNPMSLFENLVSMLKPGGYLQWDEPDLATFCAHAPNPYVGTQNCEQLLQIFHQVARETAMDFRWIADLPSRFKSSDLELVDSMRLPPIKDIRKASTDAWMLEIEEVGTAAAGNSSAAMGSLQQFGQLFLFATQDIQKGVSLETDMVVVLGKKPID